MRATFASGGPGWHAFLVELLDAAIALLAPAEERIFKAIRDFDLGQGPDLAAANAAAKAALSNSVVEGNMKTAEQRMKVHAATA